MQLTEVRSSTVNVGDIIQQADVIHYINWRKLVNDQYPSLLSECG